MTLCDFFRDAYTPRRLIGASRRTFLRYGVVLRQFASYLMRDPLLADLTDETVGGFLYSLADGTRTPATVNTARDHLLAIWRFAARKRLVEQWPDVPALREHKRVPTAWTLGQVARMLRSAAAEPGEIAGIRAAAYWPAAIVVALYTGLRRGALFSIRREDVSLETGDIFVAAEHQKHRADQLVRVRRDMLGYLAAIWQPPRELLFPWPGNEQMQYYRLRRILMRAELPHGRRDLFHRLRRSHASWVHAAGGDATAALGHSSPAVTRAYLAPNICQPTSPGDLIPALD